MRKAEKELASIRNFLRQEVEAGELELGFMQDVERDWLELNRAVLEKDHHMVKFLINEITKRFQR